MWIKQAVIHSVQTSAPRLFSAVLASERAVSKSELRWKKNEKNKAAAPGKADVVKGSGKERAQVFIA